MSLRPGTNITQNIRLVRPLGQGGMGSVWVAEHLTLRSEVAVKFIAPEFADRESSIRRFTREASLAARIRSPHVVQIFDHGVTEDETPYIVMELLDGESLGRRLDRKGRLGVREVGLLVSQAAEALRSAHGLGIVHRDIKPSNLFLLESGYELFVKVLDFGIAKQTKAEKLSELTDTGAVVGTPFYMSPEVLLCPKEADHRADLWALAVVAYHAIVGDVPFKGETLASLAVAVNEGTLEPPSSQVGGVPAEVDTWFKLALHRDIDLRYRSAKELADAFRRAAGGSMPVIGDALLREGPPSTVPAAEESAPTVPAEPPAQRAPGGAAGTELAAAVAPTEPSPRSWTPVPSGAPTASARRPSRDEAASTPEPTTEAVDAGDDEASAAARERDDTLASEGRATRASTFGGATADPRDKARGRFARMGLALGATAAALLAGALLLTNDQGEGNAKAGASEAGSANATVGAAAATAPAEQETQAEQDESSAAEVDETAREEPAEDEPPHEGADNPEAGPRSSEAGAGEPHRPRAAHPRPRHPRSTAPARAASASASAEPLPDHCKDPFLVDKDGDLIPKLECLR